MFPLKILSWNIEHFNGRGGIDKSNRKKRLDRVEWVGELLSNEKPDIFGLSEVEGEIVYDKLTAMMPGFTLHITEGPQSQEILIGVRGGLTAFFTQKNEFKRSNPALRPGALLTVRDGDVHVPILFTHLKSMPSPEGFGLRDAMFKKMFALKKKLDKASQSLSGKKTSRANFIVLGDMNTMGMDYLGKQDDIPGKREIEVVTRKFANKSTKMVVLPKSSDATWFNGSKSKLPPSNLDHVFAADHLDFKKDYGGVVVNVGGWAELPSEHEKDQWIAKFSDHAPLTFTLSGVK